MHAPLPWTTSNEGGSHLAQASKPLPTFKDRFCGKRYPVLGIFLEMHTHVLKFSGMGTPDNLTSV